MDSAFERFMRPAEGTASQKRFLARVQAAGFTPNAKEGKHHYSVADFDPSARVFEYDPSKFRCFDLFHEKQHLIAYERAGKLGIPLQTLFNAKLRSVLETDAYISELWLCERYEFPKDFTEARRALLLEYIHKARTALRNRESLRELAAQVLGYDIQAQVEQYFS